MPLKTFYNLDQNRQKEILNVCFEEFALHDYSTASLGNIIRKLGIAKGSFYRYFESKKDLYFYMLEYATQSRLNEVGDLFSDQQISFKELIVQNFAAKINYEFKNPLISGFLYNVSQEKNNEEVGNIQLTVKKKIVEMVIQLLEQHKINWQLKANLSLFDMAFLIMQVQMGIFDYLELKYGISIRENIKMGKSAFELDDEKILNDIHSFAELMDSGIKD